MCAIQKNEPDELGKPGRHPYYMIRCQRIRLQERINILRAKYPKLIIKRPTYDAANSNHFSLDNDDHRDVFEDTFDIDM